MMKRLFFPIILLLCFCACSNEDEVKDLERQIKEQEELNDRLRKEQEEAKKKQEELERENEEKRRQAEELERQNNTPRLTAFELFVRDNPLQLVENATCEIIGDSVVECWVSNIMNSKTLVPHFEYTGESISFDGHQVESGVTAIDFRKPVTVKLSNRGYTSQYTVYVHAYTGLPMVWLETEKRANISTMNWNYTASFKLVEDVRTRAPGDIIEEKIKVMAADSVKWYNSKVYPDRQIAKNALLLTFNSPISLLDAPKNNDWKLYPNDKDNTMIRTQTGMYMSRLSKLDFTPRYHFVELMLNGVYYGTYMLGDLIENSSNRVALGIDGYLLKIDSRTSIPHFSIPTVEQPISIISPVTKSGEAEYLYLRNLLDEFENVLNSSAFTSTVGWQKYLDADSFVDYYLINEIAKNEAAAFQSNCYIHFKRGEKMKMGPLFTFENAFGRGSDSSTSGFVVKKAKWYDRLFQDPAFVTLVKDRYAHFYAHKEDIIAEIEANAKYLKYAVQENDAKWDVFATSKTSGQKTSALYDKEIQSLEKWVGERMDWLNKALGDM